MENQTHFEVRKQLSELLNECIENKNNEYSFQIVRRYFDKIERHAEIGSETYTAQTGKTLALLELSVETLVEKLVEINQIVKQIK